MIKIYIVGGAIRDQLLGHAVNDKDYVVVGATPQKMLDMGYQPVGKHFPVFLHPQTHAEYALARTERKSGHGYHGFTFHADPSVSLEEDLARRDLTINAMAQSQDGSIIDPYGGQDDLKSKLLRHVSEAFSEDPVRILRIARFAARFHDFSVAPQTMQLMQLMVKNGEAEHLVPERTWKELSIGLMEAHPERMIQVLHECGALKTILPEVEALFGVPQRPEFHPEIDTGLHVLLCLQQAAQRNYALPARFAVLTHDLGKGTTPPEEWPRHHGHEQRSAALSNAISKRLKVPVECKDIAYLNARYHGDIGRAMQMRPSTLVKMLSAMDALRRPQRFEHILEATRCDFAGRTGFEKTPFPEPDFLLDVLHAMRKINEPEIAQKTLEKTGKPSKIGEQIHQARVHAVKQFLKTQDLNLNQAE